MIRWMLDLACGDSGRGKLRRRHASHPVGGWSRREVLFARRRKPKPDARWRVQIDSSVCSDCGACVRICRRSALTRREDDTAILYMQNAPLCDGCGDCKQVCAAKALCLERVSQPIDQLDAARLSITSCSRCGKRGAGRVNGLCITCRQCATRLGVETGRQRC
jgi:ferredoxin